MEENKRVLEWMRKPYFFKFIIISYVFSGRPITHNFYVSFFFDTFFLSGDCQVFNNLNKCLEVASLATPRISSNEAII